MDRKLTQAAAAFALSLLPLSVSAAAALPSWADQMESLKEVGERLTVAAGRNGSQRADGTSPHECIGGEALPSSMRPAMGAGSFAEA